MIKGSRRSVFAEGDRLRRNFLKVTGLEEHFHDLDCTITLSGSVPATLENISAQALHQGAVLQKLEEEGQWLEHHCCLVPHVFLYFFDKEVPEAPFSIIDLLKYTNFHVQGDEVHMQLDDDVASQDTDRFFRVKRPSAPTGAGGGGGDGQNLASGNTGTGAIDDSDDSEVRHHHVGHGRTMETRGLDDDGPASPDTEVDRQLEEWLFAMCARECRLGYVKEERDEYIRLQFVLEEQVEVANEEKEAAVREKERVTAELAGVQLLQEKNLRAVQAMLDGGTRSVWANDLGVAYSNDSNHSTPRNITPRSSPGEKGIRGCASLHSSTSGLSSLTTVSCSNAAESDMGIHGSSNGDVNGAGGRGGRLGALSSPPPPLPQDDGYMTAVNEKKLYSQLGRLAGIVSYLAEQNRALSGDEEQKFQEFLFIKEEHARELVILKESHQRELTLMKEEYSQEMRQALEENEQCILGLKTSLTEREVEVAHLAEELTTTKAEVEELRINLGIVSTSYREAEHKCSQVVEQRKLLIKEVKRLRTELNNVIANNDRPEGQGPSGVENGSDNSVTCTSNTESSSDSTAAAVAAEGETVGVVNDVKGLVSKLEGGGSSAGGGDGGDECGNDSERGSNSSDVINSDDPWASPCFVGQQLAEKMGEKTVITPTVEPSTITVVEVKDLGTGVGKAFAFGDVHGDGCIIEKGGASGSMIDFKAKETAGTHSPTAAAAAAGGGDGAGLSLGGGLRRLINSSSNLLGGYYGFEREKEMERKKDRQREKVWRDDLGLELEGAEAGPGKAEGVKRSEGVAAGEVITGVSIGEGKQESNTSEPTVAVVKAVVKVEDGGDEETGFYASIIGGGGGGGDGGGGDGNVVDNAGVTNVESVERRDCLEREGGGDSGGFDREDGALIEQSVRVLSTGCCADDADNVSDDAAIASSLPSSSAAEIASSLTLSASQSPSSPPSDLPPSSSTLDGGLSVMGSHGKDLVSDVSDMGEVQPQQSPLMSFDAQDKQVPAGVSNSTESQQQQQPQSQPLEQQDSTGILRLWSRVTTTVKDSTAISPEKLAYVSQKFDGRMNDFDKTFTAMLDRHYSAPTISATSTSSSNPNTAIRKNSTGASGQQRASERAKQPVVYSASVMGAYCGYIQANSDKQARRAPKLVVQPDRQPDMQPDEVV